MTIMKKLSNKAKVERIKEILEIGLSEDGNLNSALQALKHIVAVIYDIDEITLEKQTINQ